MIPKCSIPGVPCPLKEVRVWRAKSAELKSQVKLKRMSMGCYELRLLSHRSGDHETTPGQKAVQVIPEGSTARGACRIPSLGGADQILGVLPGQDDLGLCTVGGFCLSTNSGQHGGGQVGQVGTLHGGCGDHPPPPHPPPLCLLHFLSITQFRAQLRLSGSLSGLVVFQGVAES